MRAKKVQTRTFNHLTSLDKPKTGTDYLLCFITMPSTFSGSGDAIDEPYAKAMREIAQLAALQKPIRELIRTIENIRGANPRRTRKILRIHGPLLTEKNWWSWKYRLPRRQIMLWNSRDWISWLLTFLAIAIIVATAFGALHI